MGTKILVFGANGYIGSVLVPILLDKGYEVTILIKKKPSIITHNNADKLKIIFAENYSLKPYYFKDIDVVIDLISFPNLNSKLVKKLNISSNHIDRISFSKKYDVKKYIYISSCSVYGYENSHKFLSENSPLSSLSYYAQSKIEIEQDFLKFNEDDFKIVILRTATVFGYSPNMRFDLLINFLITSGLQHGEICFPDVNFTRPYIHINDVGILLAEIASPKSILNESILNLGFTKNNISSYDLIYLISDSLNVNISDSIYEENDLRSYKISFKKLENILKPGNINSLKKDIIETSKAIQKTKEDMPLLPLKFNEYKDYICAQRTYSIVTSIFSRFIKKRKCLRYEFSIFELNQNVRGECVE